ncbi:MAG: hypothetical protein AB7F88_13280 [Pyrinomonadaceae bacterium]
MDALIRREAEQTITISERAGLHLDADEIAAFAEGAVPSGSRATFVRHFAECDTCRRTLGNAIRLNAGEAASASPGVAAPAAVAAVPWYRRLFRFPNLAYVMGGLVVLFAGFIGVSVITFQSASSDVSMMEPAGNRTVMSESQPSAAAPISNANADLGLMSNTAANAPYGDAGVPSANTASNTVAARRAPADAPVGEGVIEESRPSGPPPATKNEDFTLDGADASRIQEQRVESAKESKDDQAGRAAQAAPPPKMASVPRAKAPARRDDRKTNTDSETAKTRTLKKSEPLPPTAETSTLSSSSDRKKVGSRTFEFRQGAWYDTTYRGQGTINVRRNTKDYGKLDGGLKTIAESFLGTVVVTIWNGRAYRIQ